MLKMTHGAVSLAIPRMELLDAAKKFVLHSDANQDLVLVENVDSPKFGSSDLLFINGDRTNLTIGKLSDRESNETFVISSICYYFWLMECITAGRAFFNGKTRADMYLFSHEFSDPIRYLLDNLCQVYPIYLIQYHIINVENLDGPAIHFQHVNFKGRVQETLERTSLEGHILSADKEERAVSQEISDQELREFHRLKEQYLD
jgi:hypothetical protein